MGANLCKSFFACSVDTMASYGQLLNAPSFDDATLFDQVDIQPSSSKEQKQEEEQDTVHTNITVDDPVKRTEQTIIPGMSGGYVTYRISTTTSLPTYAQKTFSVRRRFRDLVVSFLLLFFIQTDIVPLIHHKLHKHCFLEL